MMDWVHIPLTSEEGNPLYISQRDGSLAEERDGAYLVAYHGALYRVPVGAFLESVASGILDASSWGKLGQKLPDVGMMVPRGACLELVARRAVCPVCYTTHPEPVGASPHVDTLAMRRDCPTCKRSVEGEWRLRG